MHPKLNMEANKDHIETIIFVGKPNSSSPMVQGFKGAFQTTKRPYAAVIPQHNLPTWRFSAFAMIVIWCPWTLKGLPQPKILGFNKGNGMWNNSSSANVVSTNNHADSDQQALEQTNKNKQTHHQYASLVNYIGPVVWYIMLIKNTTSLTKIQDIRVY